MITAAMLYDFTRCPYRVELDLYGDPSKRDPINPFVQMLWERGRLFEREVLDALEIKFTDLTKYGGDEKEKLTTEAMERGDELILGGRMQQGDLLGDPDILRKEGKGYIAGDIKSGAGEEGGGDSKKLKKHYAVQLALYTDILERKGISGGRRAFVWDIHGEEVDYDFSLPQGPKTPQTYWEYYQSILEIARGILEKREHPTAAICSGCKMCHWYSFCKSALNKQKDLTLIPDLGRGRRDAMIAHFKTVLDLAKASTLPAKIKGVGADMLKRFQVRAQLLSDSKAKPYLTKAVTFPSVKTEIFFDVETDPMRDICYLHGFVARNVSLKTEKYIGIFMDEINDASEKEAFKKAFEYLNNHTDSCFYYFSKYERTTWRKLQKKYPDVCSEDAIENLFSDGRSVDLYDVVKKSTEWPTNSHSIKELFFSFS